MYIFGGKDEDNKKLNDLWCFDFEQAVWNEVPALNAPSPRSGHSVCVYKDFMVIFGGIFEVT